MQYALHFIDLIITCSYLASKFHAWNLCNDYLESAKGTVKNMLKYVIYFAYNYLYTFCINFVYKLYT